MLHIRALGSGSAGNAIALWNDHEGVLIDAGFSRRELLRRLELCEISPTLIRAVLLTHEHEDHLKGCRLFCDELGIPLCTAAATAAYLKDSGKLPERVRIFEPGTPFTVGSFTVEPFSVQHDAVSPVGFVVHDGPRQVGVATDLGCLNHLAEVRLGDCDALVLESNYDAEMLRASHRPPFRIRRIFGPMGHLDNRVACAALERLLAPRTHALLLAHISRECNDPGIIEPLFRSRLAELGREDVRLCLLKQEEPAERFDLE